MPKTKSGTTKIKTNPPIKPKKLQVKKYSKYYVGALLLIYILKVYGSLILNKKFGLISDDLWCYIHYVGTCALLCSFLYLLKDKVNSFIYSLGMSIFVSRLITQLSDTSGDGEEYWYEMISIIIITCILYFISTYKKKK